MSDRFAPLHGALLGALLGFLISDTGLASFLGPLSIVFSVVVLACVGAVLGALRRHVVLAFADAALLAVWAIIVYTPLSATLATRWVRDDRAAEPAHVDGVIALSSGVSGDSAIDVYGVDRLLGALEVMKRGVAPRLLTIQVASYHHGVDINSEPDQRRLIDMAGETPVWTSIRGAGSTHDEAMLARRTFPAGEPPAVIVVTSPIHTRRACATFEGAGFRVYCHPAREHEFISWRPDTRRDRLATLRAYLYERLGMIKYRRAGWVR